MNMFSSYLFASFFKNSPFKTINGIFARLSQSARFLSKNDCKWSFVANIISLHTTVPLLAPKVILNRAQLSIAALCNSKKETSMINLTSQANSLPQPTFFMHGKILILLGKKTAVEEIIF